MTVQTFTPNQTTTLETAKKTIAEQSQNSQTTGNKIGFVSLGCPKNLVDSERILTQLRTEGYEIVNSYHDSDVVIVNTCGFIGAREDEIRQVHPNVLGITGPHAYQNVLEHVHQYAPKPAHNPFTSLVPDHGVKLTPKHYAYLKISEGCNHRCTFCIIPSMRGDLVSRPVGEIIGEAERLKNAGVKELLVISQDTSAYGVDTKHSLGFANGSPVRHNIKALSEELGKMGIWVRLHYAYPYPHVEEIIPLMAEGKVLPYLDIPFQHASPRVLKMMKRPGQAERTLERIKKWREICPELVIRSTFIVGFPGETEEDFQILLDWLKEAQLDRVGCFKYSPVEGAAANEIEDQIPEDVKQDRFERFMLVQQEISAAKLQKRIGSTMQVLIDEVDEEGAIGRTYADAPEIDGLVYLVIEHADEYDLWGSILHDAQ